MIAHWVHSVLNLTHKLLGWKRFVFWNIPFPLAYKTTVFESNCWWGGVRKGKDSSNTEVQPFSPWLLVALNLVKKKREFSFFKDSDKNTFQSICSRMLLVQLAQKHFGLDGALSLQGTAKQLVQKRKKSSYFWVVLMSSWSISGIQQPMRQHWWWWLCLDFLCVTWGDLGYLECFGVGKPHSSSPQAWEPGGLVLYPSARPCLL